jgi:hypothetical protein
MRVRHDVKNRGFCVSAASAAVLCALTVFWPGRDTFAQGASVDVRIEVFSCASGASDQPELRIWKLTYPTFAAVPVDPRWLFDGRTWQTTVSVPRGHYIVDSFSKNCSGHGEQWVAAPGQLRHITEALNEALKGDGRITSVDENMYAGAVYGQLPAAPARVEMMSAGSVVGEQTRRTATVDGDVYQINYLRHGSYVLRIVFGDVVVSRQVTVPDHVYGPVVRADLTPSDAAEIVRAEAAGAGFVTVRYNGTEPLKTFRLGNASVDGWTTNPLLPPSDYRPDVQRVSAPALAALAGAERFLTSDDRIPVAFKSLSAWSAKITAGGVQKIRVDLFSTDSAAWQKVAPQTRDTCIPDPYRGDVILLFDEATLKLTASAICR